MRKCDCLSCDLQLERNQSSLFYHLRVHPNRQKCGDDKKVFVKKGQVINMNNHKNTKKTRTGLKDTWNAFMCKGAKYSEHDIPFCPTVLTGIPKEIITWEEAKQLHKKLVRKDRKYFYDAFICFYMDDYKFDGVRSSIWLFPWLALRVLKHFRGIITPDFSTYQDFPYPLKLWNTFRMRSFGYWAGTQGLEVINNVRWGTSETYHYCFDGIDKDSVVAIGTVGGSPRKVADRKRFVDGLEEMVMKLEPHTIIVYGSADYPCFKELEKRGIRIIAFKSYTAKYYEGRTKDE